MVSDNNDECYRVPMPKVRNRNASLAEITVDRFVVGQEKHGLPIPKAAQLVRLTVHLYTRSVNHPRVKRVRVGALCCANAGAHESCWIYQVEHSSIKKYDTRVSGVRILSRRMSRDT